ncbi:protein serine/threonine phosphatase 2C [Trichodelitschia bisporula]|uniref:Protein phosphatase n=1 Tax=Trichodelitschia bisporula TaxID=703511 RepID=A0A6G1HXB6_9PEZI|nr:protein serine/threonine phosphatase 2C [Trichodelitschia bisporula]
MASSCILALCRPHTHALSSRCCASALRTPLKAPAHSALNLAVSSARHFSSTPRAASTPAPPSPLTYGISAAYCAKRSSTILTQPFDPSARPYTSTQAHKLPLRTRRKTRPASGQDAFFVATAPGARALALGVVDGVGGWENEGVDPADFAHSMCEHMASAAERFPEGFEPPPRTLAPRALMETAYEKVLADREIAAGGSTACVAVIDSAGTMDAANLGDSGFIHLAPFRIRYASPPQTHQFNTPFQLSKMSARQTMQAHIFGGKPLLDQPSDAALTHHTLSHGDVVLFASDGVWDNLAPEDLLRLVSRIMLRADGWVIVADEAGIGPALGAGKEGAGVVQKDGGITKLARQIALTVATEAKKASLSERDGPFAREVRRVHPQWGYTGGKEDDICVVVAVAGMGEGGV